MSGLENKLDGAKLGDLIILKSSEFQAAGYIIEINSEEIKLSHENPITDNLNPYLIGYRQNISK